MRSKIAFVETNPPNDRGVFTKCNDFEPYGLELLAAIAKREGFEVDLWQQNGRPTELFASEIATSPPDILALSAMAYNYPSAISLAENLKKQFPKLKTIIGGSHVSSCPSYLEPALRDGTINFGIRGEGENSFRELINSIENPSKDLSGLITLDNGVLKINSNSRRIMNLDSLPFALRRPDKIPTRLGKIMYPAQSQQTATTTLAYSRGCPFCCTYCDSKSIWGNTVIWRSPSNVADEMQEVKNRYGTDTLFFSDLTFNSNPERVHALCDELIKRNLGISWYVLARVASPNGDKLLIDKGLLEKMRAAGCRKIGYGLESVIPEVQTDFNKRIPNEYIEQLARMGDEMGIISKGFLILGDPNYESPVTIKQTLKELKRIKFDEIRLSVLTPFPGSALYDSADSNDLLLTKDLSKYTTDEQIIKCRNITFQELKDWRRWLASEYYTSREYLKMVHSKASRFPELIKPYEEHREFLREVGLI